MIQYLLFLIPLKLARNLVEASEHGQLSRDFHINQCIWDTQGALRSWLPRDCSSLIHGTKIFNPYSPWDYPPHCTTPNRERRRSYCLYTKSVVDGNGGMGFSVISTPDNAADITSSGALDPPEPLSHSCSMKGCARSGPVGNEHGPAYAIMDLYNKGKGVIALRSIAQGEILMRDMPVLVYSNEFAVNAGSENRRRLLRLAFDRLPNSTQEMFMSLARVDYGENAMEDTIITNICTFSLGHNAAHKGLFLEFSVRCHPLFLSLLMM